MPCTARAIIHTMKLDSTGILISLRQLGERDLVAHIFTYDYGVMCGMIRGGAGARKNKPLVGQIGAVTWNARLDSQLGTFHWDADRNLAAPLMLDATRLAFMNSAFDLLDRLLPERAQYETLYNETVELLINLTGANPRDTYLTWEINLLRELGYALDISRCAACGRTTNLNYLSPRTGRAVCDGCATPYVSRLYKLPLNLNVTLRFIDSVCAGQGCNLPLARRTIKNAF